MYSIPKTSRTTIILVATILSSCAGPDLKRTHAFREAFLKAHPESLKTTRIDSRTVRYASAGSQLSKRPLLFIHGSPGSWDGWAEFLSDESLTEHFFVIAVDRPGYGGSDPGVPERSLATQAAVLAGALKEARGENARPAILVGHSYGGPLAVRMAIDYPELVGAIAVVAGAVSPELEETKWYQLVANTRPFRWLVPRDLDVCNQEILALKASLEKMAEEWDKVSCPVYLLHGDKDPLVPVKNVDFARKHLKSSKSVEVNVVPGMNHFVPWEHPDLIREAISRLAALLDK